MLVDLETDRANIVLVPALIERLEGKPNSKDPSTFRIDLKEKNTEKYLDKIWGHCCGFSEDDITLSISENM